VEWDRSWSQVIVSLRSTALPPVTEMRLFEGPGLRAPTDEGEVIVRIDRSTYTPRFVLSIDGRQMVPVTDEDLPASAVLTPWNPGTTFSQPRPNFAPLAAAAPAFSPQPPFRPQPPFAPQPPLSPQNLPVPSLAPTTHPTSPPLAAPLQPKQRGNRKSVLSAVGAIVIGLLVVAVGVVGLQQWGDSHKQIVAAPTTPPVPTYATTIPVTFASVYEHLVQQANFYGAPNPQVAATCMQTEYPNLTDGDIDLYAAPYRSAQYRCMPDQMTLRWEVTATGIQESDKPCANKGSTNGMAKLTLEEMERTEPYSNTADYPPDIQDKMIAEIKATCPALPADIAERVIKE
jgi:hypothetical protein